MGTATVEQRRIALAQPQVTPAGPFSTVWAVDVTVEDGGRRGIGTARAFSQAHADMVEAAARALCADERVTTAIAGGPAGDARVTAWRPMWDVLLAEAGPGPAITALAGLDDAVWDLAREESAGPAAPAAARSLLYWSGLWLQSSIAELVDETRWALALGFDAVKLRVDGTSIGPSIERALAVVEVSPAPRWLGLEFAGSGTPESVAAVVTALPHDRLLWVEDPLPAGSEDDVRALGDRLGIPIATGEDCWGLPALRDRVHRTGAGVPVVDLGFVGGSTALHQYLAEGANGRAEIGVHIDALAAATVVARSHVATTVWLEVFDWWGMPDVAAVRARAAGRAAG